MPRTITVTAERSIAAAPDRVFALLADYRDARPRMLTEHYRDYRVEEGGTGAGTVVAYELHAGRRVRPYRLRVEEPIPGRELRERDQGSSLTTTWTVAPQPGDGTSVRVTTSWAGARGVGGVFERLFAPLGLRRIYEQQLERLAGAVAEA